MKNLLLLLFIPIVFACGGESDCSVQAKKVLIVYPNKTETHYITDFTDIVKDFWSSGTKSKISINEFNNLKDKYTYVDYEDKYNQRLEIKSDIKHNQIYQIIKSNKLNKLYVVEYIDTIGLNQVWNFNDKYQFSFIKNSTGKDLYIERIVYGEPSYAEYYKEKITPNQIIESPLPSYFFEDEPPSSISRSEDVKSGAEIWLHY